jgi:pyruvate formate lyase activating enzyme
MIKTTGGRPISSAEVLRLLKKQQPYFGQAGGLTLSGGEPTVQAKEVLALVKAVQRAGYHVALDTNGGLINEEVKELYRLVDLVLLDVKQINPAQHRLITGQDNANTLQLAALREELGKPFWLRYVLVPGYSDQVKDLEAWAKHFQSYRHLERVEILPYHTLGVYKYKELGWPYQLSEVVPPSLEQIKQAENVFRRYLPQVYVR